MRLSASALSEAGAVAAAGHTGAASDVGVAIALVHAGLHGAKLNVEINVGAMRDDEYASAARETAAQQSTEGEAFAQAAERALASPNR
jgi:formiminotetrahydrofolate cyclodeaminase